MGLTTNHFTRVAVYPMLVALMSACGGDGEASSERLAPGDVLVFQGRQSVQCGPKGLTPEQGAQTLINGGIDVLKSGCGALTNAVYPAVCGAPDGNILLHEIRRENLQDAERLGLKDTATLRNSTTGAGYVWVDCDTGATLP